MKRLLPTNAFETELWNKNHLHIAGVDEVGRGCFAGPVVAGAVILPHGFENTCGIDDSKRLSPKKREELAEYIKKIALAYAVAEISVQVINTVGIGKAVQLAFAKAVMNLNTPPDHILVDAFVIQSVSPSVQTPIIHGDRLSVTIAVASIIAKVYRDELMRNLHKEYEVYDFITNKGYGTKTHRLALAQYGLSPLHRTSFNLSKYTG